MDNVALISTLCVTALMLGISEALPFVPGPYQGLVQSILLLLGQVQQPVTKPVSS
jgi:hypothetical protein